MYKNLSVGGNPAPNQRQPEASHIMSPVKFYLLPQWRRRDRATRYVSWNLVNCCTAVRNIPDEKVCNRSWSWRSFKVTGITAIPQE